MTTNYCVYRIDRLLFVQFLQLYCIFPRVEAIHTVVCSEYVLFLPRVGKFYNLRTHAVATTPRYDLSLIRYRVSQRKYIRRSKKPLGWPRWHNDSCIPCDEPYVSQYCRAYHSSDERCLRASIAQKELQMLDKSINEALPRNDPTKSTPLQKWWDTAYIVSSKKCI